MRSSEAIKTEIVQRFGFFPPFYESAMNYPAILENLWTQTLTAYLDNPLPALFKEKLAALLSRYCPVPYTLVCHTATLRPLGMTSEAIATLLKSPVPELEALKQIIHKARAKTPRPLEQWPESDVEMENALLQLAMAIYQNPEDNLNFHTDLKQLVSPEMYDYLILFIAYNKTCLSWAEAHPELSYEADQRAQENLGPLLRDQPELAEFFRDYPQHYQRSLKWRQQEKSLRKTENLFQLLVEGVMDYAIIVIDLNGVITEWNVGAERLLAYPPHEVLGEPFEIFFTPEDRAAGVHLQELATARVKGHARDERFHLRKDGQRIWVKGFMNAIKSEDGTLQAYAKIIQDVTERKKIEEELARSNEELEERVKKRTQELAHSQSALHQAQKLEAIGQLAGGVAHDFNNLITGILGMSEELKESLPLEDARREDVAEIIKAANRAFAVTRQLLAFGRRTVTQPRVVEPKLIVTELHKLLLRVLHEDIDIRLNLGETGRIRIDPGQFEQILMNLAINARDAMPKGGTLTLETADVILEDGDVGRHFQVPAGPYVMVKVSDSGHGMTPEVMSHMFEPFFTTKEKERGTGLGLATVYGIVKQSGGDIHVYSDPGFGTSFKIYFPVVKAEVLVPPDSAVDPSPRGHESILVVEDEDIVRRVVVKRLRQEGYSVVEARNGQEAVQSVTSGALQVDLIITDVVMPGMTGKEVIEKIRQLRPDIPALYMSGYPEDIIAHRGELVPGIDFIEKGDLSSGLSPKVRQMLDRNPKQKPPAA